MILVKGEKKEGCMSSLGTLTHSPERAEKMLFQYYAQKIKTSIQWLKKTANLPELKVELRVRPSIISS